MAKPGQVCPVSPVSHVLHDFLVRGPGQSRVRVIAPTDLQKGEADDFGPQLVEEGIAGVQIWGGEDPVCDDNDARCAVPREQLKREDPSSIHVQEWSVTYSSFSALSQLIFLILLTKMIERNTMVKILNGSY